MTDDNTHEVEAELLRFELFFTVAARDGARARGDLCTVDECNAALRAVLERMRALGLAPPYRLLH